MEFQDRQLTCLDCAQPFVFTAGEQEFYQRKGFKEEPKRCKPCRETRKQRRNGAAAGAAGANGSGNGHGHGNGRGNGNGSGRGNGYGLGDGSGNAATVHDEVDDDIGNRAAGPGLGLGSGARGPRDARDLIPGPGRGPRELHDATCAQCGAPARVPFRPVAGRPVYCRDCYGARARPS